MMFTNPEIGIIQLASFIVIILLGFPIAFTLDPRWAYSSATSRWVRVSSTCSSPIPMT